MTTTAPQGYSSRYQKIKSSKLRSLSPNHHQYPRQHSPHMNKNISNTNSYANNNSITNFTHSNPNTNTQLQAPTQLGKVISNISDRVDGIQIKIVNITNIIKLFQKYTETRDIQYQKQKQNQQYKKNMGNGTGMTNINSQNMNRIYSTQLQSLEIQKKIQQMQSIMHRAKAQITAMQGIRISVQRQRRQIKQTRQNNKIYGSPQQLQTLSRTNSNPHTHPNPKTTIDYRSPQQPLCVSSPNNTQQIMQQIEQIMQRMQISLREEMNKKIQICMNIFKSALNNNNNNNITNNANTSKNQSPSIVNTIMMQQQIHNITLSINKVQSDCHRYHMLTDRKIQHIIQYISQNRTSSRNKDKSKHQQQIHNNNNRSGNRQQVSMQDINTNNSRSKSKSKSKKYNKLNTKQSRQQQQQQNQQNKSQYSSISKKSQKSKSKSKPKSKSHKNNTNPNHTSDRQINSSNNISQNGTPKVSSFTKIQQQKKQKQLELKQALRKKKQNQEKLKMKK